MNNLPTTDLGGLMIVDGKYTYSAQIVSTTKARVTLKVLSPLWYEQKRCFVTVESVYVVNGPNGTYRACNIENISYKASNNQRAAENNRARG
jgi:hypothetical protein